MLKIYDLNRKLNKHGFYTISKKCINGYFGNFNELLKTDQSKLIKSAICSWFEDKYGKYAIVFNGYECIYLQSEKTNEIEEIYFPTNYQVYNGYLIHYDDWKIDYHDNKKLIDRYIKINKIRKNIVY